jgi:alkylation response protein AidB-like acyl-CoA dehydrogenase
MRDAGLFHVMIPESLGGPGVDPLTASRVVEEAARLDGSVGWCLMIAAQNAAFAGFLPAGEARAIWGNGGIACGTARPIGRAVWNAARNGYDVSGRWPLASGSTHADWFAAECMVYDGDDIRKDAEGNDVSRMVFVPASEVTIHDTWDTLGLRGTASNDFSIESSFVPAERGFQVIVSQPVDPWPVYKTPGLVFMNHGAHALGIGRGALDTAAELMNTKRGWGNVPIREVASMQQTIAEATALVESASAYMYGTAEQLWEVAQEGGNDPMLRMRVRLAASHAARASAQAVDLLHAALATSAIYTKSPLERQFRDIHTATAHVMIGPLTYQAAGRVILGLEAAFPFF